MILLFFYSMQYEVSGPPIYPITVGTSLPLFGRNPAQRAMEECIFGGTATWISAASQQIHPLSLLRRQLPRWGSQVLASPSGEVPRKRAKGCIFGGEATWIPSRFCANAPPQTSAAPPEGEPSSRFPLRGGKRTDFVGSHQATEKSVRCFPVWEVSPSGDKGGCISVAKPP